MDFELEFSSLSSIFAPPELGDLGGGTGRGADEQAACYASDLKSCIARRVCVYESLVLLLWLGSRTDVRFPGHSQLSRLC